MNPEFLLFLTELLDCREKSSLPFDAIAQADVSDDAKRYLKILKAFAQAIDKEINDSQFKLRCIVKDNKVLLDIIKEQDNNEAPALVSFIFGYGPDLVDRTDTTEWMTYGPWKVCPVKSCLEKDSKIPMIFDLCQKCIHDRYNKITEAAESWQTEIIGSNKIIKELQGGFKFQPGEYAFVIKDNYIQNLPFNDDNKIDMTGCIGKVISVNYGEDRVAYGLRFENGICRDYVGESLEKISK
jgi:hypothetical protein